MVKYNKLGLKYSFTEADNKWIAAQKNIAGKKRKDAEAGSQSEVGEGEDAEGDGAEAASSDDAGDGSEG